MVHESTIVLLFILSIFPLHPICSAVYFLSVSRSVKTRLLTSSIDVSASSGLYYRYVFLPLAAPARLLCKRFLQL